jgi:hypothetical protein
VYCDGRLRPTAWHHWPSPVGKVDRCTDAARTQSAVTMPRLCTVARLLAALWRSAGGKVFSVSMRRHPGWRQATEGALGLTRMAWHRRGQKMGPATPASTSVVTPSEQWRWLKAHAAPGSLGGGKGQDQSTRKASGAALSRKGQSRRRWRLCMILVKWRLSDGRLRQLAKGDVTPTFFPRTKSSPS